VDIWPYTRNFQGPSPDSASGDIGALPEDLSFQAQATKNLPHCLQPGSPEYRRRVLLAKLDQVSSICPRRRTIISPRVGRPEFTARQPSDSFSASSRFIGAWWREPQGCLPNRNFSWPIASLWRVKARGRIFNGGTRRLHRC
jgi:hypothetical protein